VNTNFKGPMTGTPLPGVTKKIRKLLLARQEVAEMIERLIAILDEIDSEAELEPSGDEEEPTLGWTASSPRILGSTMDGEAEPSLGWTDIVNQASHNRQCDGTTFSLDGEKDDADDEDSDPGEESDEGELEPDAEPNGDEMDGNLAGTTSEVEAAMPPSRHYITRLRKRRGQPGYHRTEHGFHNVGSPVPLPNESITIVYPDGTRQDFDRLGYPVVRNNSGGT
jgi:hypothetical protein